MSKRYQLILMPYDSTRTVHHLIGADFVATQFTDLTWVINKDRLGDTLTADGRKLGPQDLIAVMSRLADLTGTDLANPSLVKPQRT
jgi:hypothetical protein